MERAVDVVIVGGGISGSALAGALATAGLDVLVLERQTTYRDKVRGEYLQPWGVAEAERLGMVATLLAMGGSWVTEVAGYDEVVPASQAPIIPLRNIRPDVPGAMDLGHPQTCGALAQAACEAGVQFLRGVGDVTISPGSWPRVRYELDDVEHEVRCRLIVGADGRASSVRRQLGLALHGTEPRTWGSGMLVSELDSLPVQRAALGTEDDVLYLIFPREGGMARLYLWYALDQADRFLGPERQREFLDAFQLDCLPYSEAIVASEPAGPCAKYPMNDTWTDVVAVPGVVLIGDAAGYNDAIIGEGLSIALRDARTVADTLTGGTDWSPEAFDAYTDERRERMRRLRISASLITELRCTFTERGRARRAAFFGAVLSEPLFASAALVGPLAGPEAAPAEAFEPSNIDRILTLA